MNLKHTSHLCKYLYIYLHATFVFFCATFVVETNFVNMYLFWLVTYSYYSTCSYSIFLLDIFEKLINIYFGIWHNDILLIKLL